MRACGLLIAALSIASVAPAQQVNVIAGGANLMHRAPIPYPPEALKTGMHGPVTIEAALNERGLVTDAHVTSGLEIFRKPALQSVLDWHYLPGTPSPVQIAVDFTITPVLINGKPVAGKPPSPEQPKRDTPKLDAGIIAEIQFTGLTSQLEEAILAKLPVQEGDSFQTDMIDRIADLIKEFDEHLISNYHMLDFDGERRYFELRISYRVPVETR
jgi:hypothetical protein